MAEVQRALSILRGSDSSYAQSWAAFGASLGLCFYGTMACEMNRTERRFFGLAVLYMVTCGFTLAKTYRDRLLGDLLEDVQYTNAVVSALRGNDLWAVQVICSFVISTVFPFHTLLTAVGDGDMTGDPGFAINASIFALISTLNLAKSVRDKADAQTLDTVVFRDEHQKFTKILLVSAGSSGNFVVVLTGFVIAFCTTMGAVFWMDTEVLNYERKGFILIAALFLMTSAFHVAKLIRDLSDPELAVELHGPFKVMVGGSFLVALFIGLGGVYAMPIDGPQKRFLTNGLIFILSSALSLAKLARDRHEVAKILGAGFAGAAPTAPPAPGYPGYPAHVAHGVP
jgi:hypothetical protein